MDFHGEPAEYMSSHAGRSCCRRTCIHRLACTTRSTAGSHTTLLVASGMRLPPALRRHFYPLTGLPISFPIQALARATRHTMGRMLSCCRGELLSQAGNQQKQPVGPSPGKGCQLVESPHARLAEKKGQIMAGTVLASRTRFQVLPRLFCERSTL
jgi:hypothetical protein